MVRPFQVMAKGWCVCVCVCVCVTFINDNAEFHYNHALITITHLNNCSVATVCVNWIAMETS